MPATDIPIIVKRLGKQGVNWLQQAHPGKLAQQLAYQRQRDQIDRLLAKFSATSQTQYQGTILVDATWDNPNYWLRYAFLRSTLGLASGREIGLVGKFRTNFCQRSLLHLGIKEIANQTTFYLEPEIARNRAQQLLAQTSAPEDILQWQLPHNLPADFVYDGILKLQRSACVNLADPNLINYVAEALDYIEAATQLLNTYRFDLLVLSHVIHFRHAPLAWLALQQGIPTVLIFGNYGVARFAKMETPLDLYEWTDRPTPTSISTLPPERLEALSAAGRGYLEKRRTGHTEDIGAIYAFQNRQAIIDRPTLVKQFGWQPELPIVAVYASNWFDFPHATGMTHFRDFLQWLQMTIAVAMNNQHANWLFKAHPCDDWYGGITLTDLMPPEAEQHLHIQLVPKDWNGAALMDCIDALVTYHGTAGIEYAAIGKPVLLADRGWYHDVGFAKWPKSKEEYLQALGSAWWNDLALEETTQLAQIFAGWYFCRPSWQGSFILEDDSTQDKIYTQIPALFAENSEIIAKELTTMRDWFYSSHAHYHTYKMSLADEFTF